MKQDFSTPALQQSKILSKSIAVAATAAHHIDALGNEEIVIVIPMNNALGFKFHDVTNSDTALISDPETGLVNYNAHGQDGVVTRLVYRREK